MGVSAEPLHHPLFSPITFPSPTAYASAHPLPHPGTTMPYTAVPRPYTMPDGTPAQAVWNGVNWVLPQSAALAGGVSPVPFTLGTHHPMGSYPTPFQQQLQQQQQWLAYQQQQQQWLQQQPLEPMQQQLQQQQQFQQQQLQQPHQLVPATSALHDSGADLSSLQHFISIGAAALPDPLQVPLDSGAQQSVSGGTQLLVRHLPAGAATSETRRRRRSRRVSSGPATHGRHLPGLSHAPDHSDPDSGTDVSRTSTGSRGSRSTQARAERRRRAAHRSGSDSDASSRSEHIRREVLAAVQALDISAVLSRGLSLPGATTSAGASPPVDPQSSVQGALTADHPLEADAADSVTPPVSQIVVETAPAEPPTQGRPNPLNMMVARRRQSMETVVHGGGNPDSELRDPSSSDSPPGPPSDPPQDPPDDPAQGPEPSYPQYPEVRALFVTHDGGSLWVHQSAGVRGAATVSLPWDERRRAGVQGDAILFRIMHLLGAPLTAYARMGGRLHHAPLPLTNPRVETWVLMVDREVMDMAMGDPAAANVRSTSMGQPVWEWIPATARESEMQNFDQDGLAAWSEVSNSDCATPFVPGIVRLPQGTNLRASPDEVRLEHKTKEMVLKLIKSVTRFPRSASDTKSADKDGLLTQLEHYSNMVRKIFHQYQRRMQRALGHLPFVRICIDDVVVFSNTAAEHYEHVKQLLLTCREKGVFLKRSKCQLLKKSLRFLGHCISADGCRPQHDKVAAVRDWPELETVTHVRQFLGLAGYYRRFIHCFSEIAQPLTRLTKSDVPWEWGPMQQWAFEELKKALTSAPVLALPNIKGAADGTAPFVVQTDASGIALGGVLMQDNGDGLGLRVIAYESRQFSAAEQNYHTGERELGALHHCTTVTWRHYLIFTNFRIQGDHRPLEWLMEPGRELSRRQARWYMDLVEVGVPRMEYIKGALLLVPDALSRRPDFKDKDVREGLKEAGVIDPTSDLPKDPLATLESECFSSSPPAAHPHWAQTVDCWLSAVETLSVAEQAMDMGETIALVNPKLYKGMKEDHLDFDMPDWPEADSAKPTEAPHGPPDRAPPQIRITRSMSRAGKASTTPAPPQLVSPKTRTPTSRADASATPTEKVPASSPPPQKAPQQSAPSPVLYPQKRQASLPEDSQNWRVRAEYSSKYAEKFGPFDVDACCDFGGRNRQADRFWTDCLSEKWRGLRIWCNPPYNSKHITVEAILNKYIAEWKADPENTSAVFVLPDHQSKLPAWRKLFRKANMQIVEPARVRHPRTAPAVIRTGEAAAFRDTISQQSDSKFLRALKAEYTREGSLRSLREKVKAAPHQCLQDFRLVGEVVWRTAAGRYQLVLGEDSPLREVVIRHAHESLSSGHTGRDKTLERVLRRFYWRGAAEDVGTWVASCAVCQSVRPRGTYPDGLLTPHSIPNRPWQDVAVDFVTGLPVSERGNDAFVAFTCKLTKMVHVIPMNFGDSSAAVVARIYFDSVWRLHGAPMKIVSDRDPRFQDAFWQELMRLMGVKVARTTPYNPRSDGQAEHNNRVIEDMLRSFVDANVEDWDLFTTNVEFAINDSRSESTGFTPFELVFGFSPLSQLDLFLEAARSTAGRRTGGVGTAHEVAAKFSSQLRDARQRLELAQQRQREQFDRRHGQREYAVGDLVWIEAKHLTEKVMDRSICKKLTKRWHGPVPVTERFFSDVQMTMPEADRGAPVAYRLRLPPHWRIHDVFAQHRLKPYTSGQDAFAARDHLAVPEEVVVDGQKEAHVERILARRVRSVRGKEVEEWKVRWTGYSKAHDQWRTRDKLERGGPLQQLREFEQARLHMEAQVRDEATRRREQRGRHSAQAGMTLAHLITNPCDELDQLEQMEHDIPLPWERQERTEDGSLALVTELLAIQTEVTRMPRILVLFSGTGSVEREFLNCFPSASVVTLDSEHIWHPTHVNDILQWDYKQYPPGFFEVVWASPPCRQYSQARTTGGPPDLPQADKIVRRALQIIDYLEPKHWFMENPRDGQPVLTQRLLSWDLIRSRLERANPRAYIPCQRPCCDIFFDIYASARLKTRFRFQAAPYFVKVVPW
ncbi:hypothetical protein CYMTET_16929 [Cymbomonas tetramitiformis]|uniref:Uncharacterized protein n=1 Tax=Cymbomonas tetramitiformis TaxID=36881 RepID=A0AAE0GB94_9CHLO|nr:hypothetical protein CYMTET_16929 [Cymbomonas tetramitiformis]